MPVASYRLKPKAVIIMDKSVKNPNYSSLRQTGEPDQMLAL